MCLQWYSLGWSLFPFCCRFCRHLLAISREIPDETTNCFRFDHDVCRFAGVAGKSLMGAVCVSWYKCGEFRPVLRAAYGRKSGMRREKPDEYDPG